MVRDADKLNQKGACIFSSRQQVNPANSCKHMEYQLKHRLTGAVIIVLTGVILIPMILQDPAVPPDLQTRIKPVNPSEEDTLTRLTNIVKRNAEEGEAQSPDKLSKPENPVLTGSEPVAQATESPSDFDAEEKSRGAIVMTQVPEKSEDAAAPSAVLRVAVSKSSETGGSDMGSDAKTADSSALGWTVRVGTFAQEKYERQAIEKLGEHNLVPKRTEVITGAGQAIRIWLGPYPTEEEAKRWQSA